MLKKSVIVPLVAFVLGAMVSVWILTYAPFKSAPEKSAKPLYWVAPMDPNYRKDGPGKSLMGMDLIPVYEESRNDQDPVGTVNISAQIENQLGVKTAEVRLQSMQQTLNLAGFSQPDDTSVQNYHSRTSGWVEKLYVHSLGDIIKQGQALYDFYSPELVYAQEEFISALKTNNHGLTQSSRLKLQALGLSKRQINDLQSSKKVKQQLTFYAKKSGYITHLNVREGMYIQPQNKMLESADLSRIWVMAEVFESQAQWLETGLPVMMTVQGFANKQWQGRIDYIFPSVSASNRTQQIRVIFDNPDRQLKSNMFAQLMIQAAPLPPQLVVPENAIIVTGAGQRVVLALGDGQYRSVPVTTGVYAQGLVQIISGLEKGQKVVTSAQFLIDSESNISAGLDRIDNMEDTQTSLDRVWVQGRIHSIENNTLTLEHDPIEKWQWPSMVMSLPVIESIDASQFKQGDEIGFCLDEFENKRYIITHIEKSDSSPSNSIGGGQ